MSTLYVNTINPKTGTAVKTGGSISGSSNVSVGGNIELTGSLTAGGHVSSSGDAYVLGSISGSNNLAVGGNIEASGSLTLGGNLTVNGTTSTITTTNTVIKDSLIELNNGASSNSNDCGIVIERGSTGDNAIFMWDESADTFQVGTTTATGASTGNLSVTDAALKAGSLDISGDIDVDGTTNLDAVDIDGAVQIDNTITVGADDQGYDIIFYGDTASANLTWDTSADDLILNGAAGLIVPDGQLKLGSTAVSSTAAELNKLDGADSNVTAAKLSTLSALTDTEIGYVDGAGTSVVASKAIIADGNKDVGTIRNLTIDGTFSDGNYTFDTSGNVSGLGTVACGAITTSGVFDVTDTTDSSDATGDTGALRCEGGASIAKKLYVGTDLDVDGTTNLDAVDVDGAVQIDNTVTVGVDDTGYDVKFFGATSGQYMLWDQSADELVLTGDSKLSFNDAAGGENIVASADGHLEINSGTTIDLTAGSTVDINASTCTIDAQTTIREKLQIDIPARSVTPSATDGSVVHIEGGETITDSNTSASGTAAGFNMVSIEAPTLAATNSSVTTTNAATLFVSGAPTAGSNQTITNAHAIFAKGAVTVGVDDTGHDVKFYGNTSGAYMLWDTSADDLVLAGAAGIDLEGDLDVNGTANLDNTDIDGTFTMDGTAFDVNATSTCTIDNSNTSNGIAIGTATSGVPISIGHTTSEVTVNDNLTVTGDLTVNGATTTVSTTNMLVEDSLIELNTGAGSNSNDCGIVIERGSTGDNAIFMWDESADTFQVGTTTATGASTGNLTVTDAALKAGSLDISGNIDVDGTSNLDNTDIDGTFRMDGATFDVNATGAVTVDGQDDSNITITASGKDLDIAVAGGSTQELRLASAGTGASALHLNASAGGINIDSADTIDIDAADEITIDTTSADGHIAITSAHTAGQSILISANADAGSIVDIDAGILDIDVTGNATIDAATLTVTTDTATFTSEATDDPLVTIKNTTNDASGARLRFVKDKGAAGAANDVAGLIEFYADDANQDQVLFSEIKSQVKVHTNGQEGGKFTVSVAENDGTSTAGLIIEDGDADGELDVTIGAGTASSTTVAGSATVTTDLSVNGDTTLGNAAGDRTHVTGSFFIKNATYDYYPVNYSHNTDMLQLNGAVFLNYQTTASMGLDVYGSNTLISGSGGFLDLRDAVGNLSLSGSLSMPGFSLSTNDAGTSNTVLGKAAGAALASGGNYNLLAGENAGNDLTTGDDNVIIGYNTAVVATTMSDTVVIGSGAGAALAASSTDADGTVLVGKGAGAALTSGQYNTAIGFGALDAEDVGNGSVAIGYNALTAQNSNQAGSAFGDADHNLNTAVGSFSGKDITTGCWNVALGSHALFSEVDGDSSTAIGTLALYSQTGTNGEASNTAVGYFAGRLLTTGVKNVFIGSNCGDTTQDVDQTVIIGYGAGGANMTSAADSTVAIGFDALAANTTGAGNVAIGYEALKTNVDGDYNTAVGFEALETFEADTDGHGENTALGYHAGKAVSTGTRNTILGAFAGDALQGGDNNTFIGTAAGGATTAASDCVVIGQGAGAAVMTSDADGTVLIGKGAGAALTSGEDNVAIGKNALASEDDGDGCVAVGFLALGDQTGVSGDVFNTALGCKAGKDLTTGIKNVFIGNQAGSTTTDVDYTVVIGQGAGAANMTSAADGTVAIGYFAGAAITSGAGNTAVGFEALTTSSANGDKNTAIGYQALKVMQADTDGHGNNVAVGHSAGVAVVAGTGNTLLGTRAGDAIVEGDDCVMVGAFTDPSASDSTQQIVIGKGVTGVGNAKVTFGYGSNTATLDLDGSDTSWAAASSDERLKENIVTSEAGLSFVNDLRPVTYNWKKEKDVPQDMPQYVEGSEEPCLGHEYGKTLHGFIAQEVKAAEESHPEIKEGFNMWRQWDNGTQTVAPAALIPVLVKAIQELSAQADAQSKQIKKLETQLKKKANK